MIKGICRPCAPLTGQCATFDDGLTTMMSVIRAELDYDEVPRSLMASVIKRFGDFFTDSDGASNLKGFVSDVRDMVAADASFPLSAGIVSIDDALRSPGKSLLDIGMLYGAVGVARVYRDGEPHFVMLLHRVMAEHPRVFSGIGVFDSLPGFRIRANDSGVMGCSYPDVTVAVSLDRLIEGSKADYSVVDDSVAMFWRTDSDFCKLCG